MLQSTDGQVRRNYLSTWYHGLALRSCISRLGRCATVHRSEQEPTNAARPKEGDLKQARDQRAVTAAHFLPRVHHLRGLYGRAKETRCRDRAGNMQDITWSAGGMQALCTLARWSSARWPTRSARCEHVAASPRMVKRQDGLDIGLCMRMSTS